jgi:hypothetical protein
MTSRVKVDGLAERWATSLLRMLENGGSFGEIDGDR